MTPHPEHTRGSPRSPPPFAWDIIHPQSYLPHLKHVPSRTLGPLPASSSKCRRVGSLKGARQDQLSGTRGTHASNGASKHYQRGLCAPVGSGCRPSSTGNPCGPARGSVLMACNSKVPPPSLSNLPRSHCHFIIK